MYMMVGDLPLTGWWWDILLNVFLAIAVDNLADADALGENDELKDDITAADDDLNAVVVYEVPLLHI